MEATRRRQAPAGAGSGEEEARRRERRTLGPIGQIHTLVSFTPWVRHHESPGERGARKQVPAYPRRAGLDRREQPSVRSPPCAPQRPL
jgi:hypothetical protein